VRRNDEVEAQRRRWTFYEPIKKGGAMSLDQKEITYSLTYKEMLEILKILDESPCQELRLEIEGFKLEIIKGKDSLHPSGGVSPGPVSPAPPLAPLPGGIKAREERAAKADKKEEISGGAAAKEISKVPGIEVKSPLAGIFYRAPAPGARPFVEIGEAVEAGEQVGIVEVMKLMNSIKTPVKGIVRQILAENETTVKMGETLMIIGPA
jgi:acetyl-CoA carboxylase biotin carboxyl carrier protein